MDDNLMEETAPLIAGPSGTAISTKPKMDVRSLVSLELFLEGSGFSRTRSGATQWVMQPSKPTDICAQDIGLVARKEILVGIGKELIMASRVYRRPGCALHRPWD